jgi:glycosyltransferase involved in cell wall biosynthesis
LADSIKLLERLNVEYEWQAGLSQEQLIGKYIQADMLVFVSTFEGFGLPIVEANAIERPVVTSNASSMPEVASTAACLVDPYDISSIREGILKVIHDDDYREQLLANGRINKERFHPKAIAESYYLIYKGIYNNQLEVNYNKADVINTP